MKNALSSRAALLCGAVIFGMSVLMPPQEAAAAPFTNCDQAYTAGVAPLEMGEPGYSPDLDRDGDGVACELVDGESTPPAGGSTIGTAVQVVIHKSFKEVLGPDQCIGAWTLATVRRGSSVILSEGSFASSESRKVAVGQFIRSRMKDGMCQVLYITSAPVMPVFNVQFAGPEGELSSTFGPIKSQPVSDQPGIQQALVVHMEFEPQP